MHISLIVNKITVPPDVHDKVDEVYRIMNSGGDIMYEHISINPKVCHGQACIKGTRIPVYQIVRMLANGDTIEELLEEYPTITREDILACLEYTASLAEEQVTPIEA